MSNKSAAPEEVLPAVDKLLEQLRDLRSLLHDVKNNVFVLEIGFAKLEDTLAGESMDEALELLRVSRVSIERLKRVVQSGGEAKSRIAVTAMLLEIVEEYRDKSTALYYDFQQGEKYVEMKYSELLRIFQNIVKNAFEAMEKMQRKNLDLSVRTQGDRIAISISNSGPHIPPKPGVALADKQQLSYIFDEGFTTKSKGDGLGLATVKRLVLANKGGIKVKNLASGGVEFTLLLPAAKEP